MYVLCIKIDNMIILSNIVPEFGVWNLIVFVIVAKRKCRQSDNPDIHWMR